ncbi:MAG: 2-oxoacid:acceptor oxidoreductase family protein [Anaerolineales bacterium]
MTQTETIISGFGGQGALFAGQVLAEAALQDDLHVTWLPSYGPEMRGGTAHCTVILSDDPIGSPIVQKPKVVMALNKPSVAKYEPLVREDGLLIVNSSLVPESPTRQDIEVLLVPATAEAESLGNSQLANIVMLGALLVRKKLVSDGAVQAALEHKLSKKKDPDLVASNLQALARGRELAGEQVPKSV